MMWIQNDAETMKNCMVVQQKMKSRITICFINSLLHPKELKAETQSNMCTSIIALFLHYITAALFTIVKR